MDISVLHGSVVVGVDGSVPSSAALEWAVRQASLEARTITVIHACGVPGAIEDIRELIAYEHGLKSVGWAIAREAVSDVRLSDGGVGVEAFVTIGHPANLLVEASERAAMVVVGARGRGAITSALLGSVSGQVTREAHCPVVVVRRFADDTLGPVLVGVDGTPASVAAVEFAFHMASTRGLPIRVLHATWDLRERASSVVDTRSYAAKVNLTEEEQRLVAETITGMCEKYPDVPVSETYRRGDPVHELAEASSGASLLVVGSRGRRLVASTLLGSVSRGVVERAECPVAVVRP